MSTVSENKHSRSGQATAGGIVALIVAIIIYYLLTRKNVTTPSKLSLTVSSGNPGASLSWFASNGTASGLYSLDIPFLSNVITGNFTNTGSINGSFGVPSSTTPGGYTATITDETTGNTAKASFIVTTIPPPPVKLICQPGTYEVLTEPDGSHYVTAVSGAVNGGELPYEWTFTWSDSKVDSSSDGVDERDFSPGVSYATPVSYTVTSADGQKCTNSLFGTPGASSRSARSISSRDEFRPLTRPVASNRMMN